VVQNQMLLMLAIILGAALLAGCGAHPTGSRTRAADRPRVRAALPVPRRARITVNAPSIYTVKHSPGPGRAEATAASAGRREERHDWRRGGLVLARRNSSSDPGLQGPVVMAKGAKTYSVTNHVG
jgi:hypothetical protein